MVCLRKGTETFYKNVLVGVYWRRVYQKTWGLGAKTNLPGMKNVYDYCLKMYINHKVISHNTRQFQNELKSVVLQLRNTWLRMFQARLLR